jgi:hypothetical protein
MSDTNVIDHRAVAEAAKDKKREAMLCFIRDTLIECGLGRRIAYEANSFLYCSSAEGKEHLKRVVAVEAAADVFTHLIAEWQDVDEKHPRPEWVRTIAKQAMASFVGAFQ